MIIKDIRDIDNIKDDYIEFSSELNTDEVFDILKKINEKESSDEKFKESVKLNLKKLNKDTRISLFKKCLKDYSIIDNTIITNIICLLRKYNSFEDSFFASEHVIINSLEELLDLKLACKTELQDIVNDITITFFSLMKSYAKTDINYLDESEELSPMMFVIFTTIDFVTLSNIISKSKNIDLNNTKTISNAYFFISNMIRNEKMSDMILNILGG